MLDLFKQQKTKDVKLLRSYILDFIKDQLKKTESGEGGNIRGLQLYITCPEHEKYIYASAVYLEQEDRFKAEEVQKIADDFAIALPEQWSMDIVFASEAPTEAITATDADIALFISTEKRRAIHKERSALIKVLEGEAENESYIIHSSTRKINIGRESKVHTPDGFYRENDIAFPGSSANKSNRSISRQHAHIEWNEDASAFLLFADDGGIPPLNKIKVRTADGNLVKLLTTEIGYHLHEGDQIILGESALIQFGYVEEDNPSLR